MRHRPKTSDHLRMPTALARGLLSRLDPISRLTTGLWTLYSRDRNLKYHRYDPLDTSPQVQDLLDDLDDRADPVFWRYRPTNIVQPMH
jgi:Protein of unknown function (DUF3024)